MPIKITAADVEDELPLALTRRRGVDPLPRKPGVQTPGDIIAALLKAAEDARRRPRPFGRRNPSRGSW
jgi:hypothetical protein